MEQDKQSMTNPEQESEFAVISVPEQYRDRVLQHVTELIEKDSETSGYMMRGLRPLGLTDQTVSGTGCKTWDSGGAMDFNCVDSDK